MDEDGGKQAKDSRRRGREHAEETVYYLRPLERAEAKKESEETQKVVKLAEVEVNEEEVDCRTEGGTHFEEEGGDLDLEQVRQCREDEMNCMVKTLVMCECVSWDEATSKTGKAPTTKKWIDRMKKNDDRRELVICRLVARGFKPR